MRKLSWLFVAFGILYVCIEVFWTALTGDTQPRLNLPYLSLVGVSSIPMFFVGGFTGVLLGFLDDLNLKIKRIFLIIAGGLLISLIELIVGLILNVWLGLNIWNYNHHFLNLLGQISLQMSLVWVAVSYLGIYLDEWFRWAFFKEEHPGNIFQFFIESFSK